MTAIRILQGIVIGLLLARLLHRLRLRWTWAAWSFVLALALRSVLRDLAPPLGAATLVAAVRGRRWHREDLASGADLAETAMRRRGPEHVLRLLVHRLRSRWATAAAGELVAGERLTVGRTELGETVSIPFGAHHGGRHTLVVGATGSGKTVTATWVATRAIASGMGVVVIDPKGDGAMRAAVACEAEACAKRAIIWTPEGPAVYNPYAHGGASEIADKALAGERYTEPHYLRQAQRYLGVEVHALQAAGRKISLRVLVEHLDPERLELLARTLAEPWASATHAYLDSLTQRQRGDLRGIRDRLAIVAESDFARWLDPAMPNTPGVESFNLLGAVRDRAVVYFDLQADRRSLLAQMLGVAIVIDLQTVVASLQSSPTPTLVVIDEFSAIAAEQVTRLVARARSAGVSLLLGTQELSDLRLAGREAVLEQVLGNLSALIAHRQTVPDSAELVASLGGSRGTWKTSHRSDGHWSRTRSSWPLVRAETVRDLPTGCAAVIDLAGARDACVARMESVGSVARRAGRHCRGAH